MNKSIEKATEISFPRLANETKIVVIGLGYVGLPLAIEFGKQYLTVGFDLNQQRIQQLQQQHDHTLEINTQEFELSENLTFTADEQDLTDTDVFVVTVPTPITIDKMPDLSALLLASELVGRHIKLGGTVIYESTVYPGATEEDCIPIVAKVSGLVANKDFWYGYSPERLSPGDQARRLTTITKVTAGSTPEVAQFVDQLYASIVPAGTHLASSIKVAEAAKVIENTQRDINIGLVNELAIIFNKMGIDTQEVLEAAGTKWNFLPFTPGLVGGHCIGVDPYYLTYKSAQIGHRPEIILAGRRLNDQMGAYVATTLIKAMTKNGITVNEAKVLILGLAFKENCADIRNTKVVDIIAELKDYTPNVDVYDPRVSVQVAEQEYGLKLLEKPLTNEYDAIVIAVAHQEFVTLGAQKIRSLGNSKCLIYDLKYVVSQTESDLRL
ncbi:MAG: UDP-N-acetyl-D-galactosamine dehydrogenase [Saprospiraceae bacterium]|jgi:UDP-N-acetyl-D-galactosamine dehydrogenase